MGIRDDAFAGKPINEFVIDAHTHIFESSFNGWYQNPDFTSNEAVISFMDRLGINCIVTSPHNLTMGFMEQANSEALKAAREYYGRIYGYISICPNEGLAAVKETIRKYGGNDRFVGLKFLTGYHGPLEQPEYEYAMDFANEARCPVLCHMWNGMPYIEQFEKELSKRPGMKLMLAHQGGGSALRTSEYGRLVKDYENAYMELCGSLYNSLSVEEMADITGEDKFIYGSDMIDLDPRYDFGRVVLSVLSDDIKKKVLAGNFLKLLETSQMGKININ